LKNKYLFFLKKKEFMNADFFSRREGFSKPFQDRRRVRFLANAVEDIFACDPENVDCACNPDHESYDAGICLCMKSNIDKDGNYTKTSDECRKMVYPFDCDPADLECICNKDHAVYKKGDINTQICDCISSSLETDTPKNAKTCEQDLENAKSAIAKVFSTVETDPDCLTKPGCCDPAQADCVCYYAPLTTGCQSAVVYKAKKHGLSGGGIAGIVVGCVVGVMIIAAVIAYFMKKGKKSEKKPVKKESEKIPVAKESE
jgi:hypothetical protein